MTKKQFDLLKMSLIEAAMYETGLRSDLKRHKVEEKPMEVIKAENGYIIKFENKEYVCTDMVSLLNKIAEFSEKKNEVIVIPRNENTFLYGLNGTIHNTNVLDVSVENGEPTSVWFRCLNLPFRTYTNGSDDKKVQGTKTIKIHGILVEQDNTAK